jgi:hypothetical protein
MIVSSVYSKLREKRHITAKVLKQFKTEDGAHVKAMCGLVVTGEVKKVDDARITCDACKAALRKEWDNRNGIV